MENEIRNFVFLCFAVALALRFRTGVPSCQPENAEKAYLRKEAYLF